MDNLRDLYQNITQFQSFNLSQIFSRTRQELGLTQSELSQKLSVSLSLISLIENDKREPQPELCIKLYHLHKSGFIAIDDLLDYVEANAESVNDLAKVDTIRNARHGTDDAYYKLCVRDLQRTYQAKIKAF